MLEEATHLEVGEIENYDIENVGARGPHKAKTQIPKNEVRPSLSSVTRKHNPLDTATRMGGNGGPHCRLAQSSYIKEPQQEGVSRRWHGDAQRQEVGRRQTGSPTSCLEVPARELLANQKQGLQSPTYPIAWASSESWWWRNHVCLRLPSPRTKCLRCCCSSQRRELRGFPSLSGCVRSHRSTGRRAMSCLLCLSRRHSQGSITRQLAVLGLSPTVHG